MHARHVSLVTLIGICIVASLFAGCAASRQGSDNSRAVPIIFDTDIGNDIDDLLALAMLHALEREDRCRLLAVTISKDNDLCAPFVDMINTFYGRPNVPVGVVRDGETPEEGRYLRPPLEARNGNELLFPRDIHSSKDVPDAVSLLRETLASQSDRSVVIVVVGFSTNLARLLKSPPDEHSELRGDELVRRKVRSLSMMAGQFAPPFEREYNVYTDRDAAASVFSKWPTPIVASGFEIGRAVRYPASSIENDFLDPAGLPQIHPVPWCYRLYMDMPYDRECWDLTSLLQAVEPDADYFGLSAPGTVTVDENGVTHFTPSPTGRVRHLTISEQQIERVRLRLVELVTAPSPETAAMPDFE